MTTNHCNKNKITLFFKAIFSSPKPGLPEHSCDIVGIADLLRTLLVFLKMDNTTVAGLNKNNIQNLPSCGI